MPVVEAGRGHGAADEPGTTRDEHLHGRLSHVDPATHGPARPCPTSRWANLADRPVWPAPHATRGAAARLPMGSMATVPARRPVMSRTSRDVVFVDGVRTPFGKAGGMYADTRADDLVDPLHPRAAAPQPAAAARAGRRGRHRRHHPDRRPGPDHRPHRRAAGRPAQDRPRLRHRPDVRRRDDRRDDGRLAASPFGAYDVAIAGGVEHMGRHPMGEGVDPNPRILAEKLVDPSALVMGSTAENLHDRLPHITKERADAFAPGLASRRPPRRTPTASSSPTWSPWPPATPRPAGAWPPWTRRPARPRWRSSPR